MEWEITFGFGILLFDFLAMAQLLTGYLERLFKLTIDIALEQKLQSFAPWK